MAKYGDRFGSVSELNEWKMRLIDAVRDHPGLWSKAVDTMGRSNRGGELEQMWEALGNELNSDGMHYGQLHR